MLVSIRLYIPLCFYYITQTAARLHIPLPTLHSTMLLLYRGLPYNKDSRCQALPSTMLLLYQTQKSAQMMLWSPLHSTMLLLYPACHYLTPPALFAFTFHYASTISTPLLVYAPFPLYFTFHYASTISSCPFCWTAPICALHSTMLLLYHVSSSPRNHLELTLHSTMLLLYHFPEGFCLLYISPLHSTMLLLYLFSTVLLYNLVISLHSTMLLLYLTSSLKESSPFRLYIPLCFYYIEEFCILRGVKSFLYIPLCFYYILYNGRVLRSPVIFTFHYASTISVSSICPGIWFSSFTFHYASTISSDDIVKAFFNPTLHSTMLLLYPTAWQAGELEIHLYIPLCFYYI